MRSVRDRPSLPLPDIRQLTDHLQTLAQSGGPLRGRLEKVPDRGPLVRHDSRVEHMSAPGSLHSASV